MTEETALKQACREYLSYTGWFCFHLLGGLGSYKGAPDMIAVKNGKVLFLEFKSPKGKQSLHQRQFQEDLEARGGKYLIVRKLEDLMERKSNS